MASRRPDVYITPWHNFRVTEKTEVVFVPATTCVLHACRTPDPLKRRLEYERPIHAALPAAYCQECDMLYVGLSEEEAHRRLDALAGTRP